MIVKRDIDQGSEAWHKLHGSVPSASNFDKIVTTKGMPSKQAEGYMMQLAGTRVFGVFEDSYQSWNMTNGIVREQDAKDIYESITENEVENVGFCYFDERLDRGCSPDGLVGSDGIIEIKSPLLKTLVKYMLDDKLPTEYYQQCQGELYITGREWLDFVGYFPGVPLFIKRVYPDKEFIKKLDAEITVFNEKLSKLCDQLCQRS